MLLDKFVEEQIKKLDDKMSTERQAGNIEFAKGVECAKSILVASMSELLLGVEDEQSEPVQKVAPSGWRYAHPNALDDMPEAFLSQLTDNSWKNDALPIFSAPIDEKYTLVIFLDFP